MAVDFCPAPFAFVIDTDTYAGNFERELCAFMTGQAGECGIGVEIAENVREEIPPAIVDWFDGHVLQVPDEHGCHRPVSIWPTPGWYNDGHGGHWKDGEGPCQNRYPAYQSVAIFMDESPHEGIVGFLLERAPAYKEYRKDDPFKSHFTITMFRVIQLAVTETEVCRLSFAGDK